MKHSSCIGVVVFALAGCTSTAPAPMPVPAEEPPSVVEPIEPEESAAEPAKVEAKPAQQPALGRCSPKDVSAFEPRWTPPAKFRHVCTEEQILALTPCATFKASKKECARFLDGPEADVT
ncbi:MAG TPA: hypothetical protein VM925_26730, partial [Labilithrix sp.]|nr:hypothetical protein [Labilithrix sp.]